MTRPTLLCTGTSLTALTCTEGAATAAGCDLHKMVQCSAVDNISDFFLFGTPGIWKVLKAIEAQLLMFVCTLSC